MGDCRFLDGDRKELGVKAGRMGNGGEDLKGEDEGRLLPGYKIN